MSKKSDLLRNQDTPTVFGHELDRKTLAPIKKRLDLSPGDFGCDPLGNGMFKMIPSGDVVDEAEKERRLRNRRR